MRRIFQSNTLQSFVLDLGNFSRKRLVTSHQRRSVNYNRPISFLRASAVDQQTEKGLDNRSATSNGAHHVKATALTFQEAIARLQEYWSSKGCALWQPHNSEVRCFCDQVCPSKATVNVPMYASCLEIVANESRQESLPNTREHSGCPSTSGNLMQPI